MKAPPQTKTLSNFILAYQQARPYFFAFIRPQEAWLFYTHYQYLKKPILDFGCGDGFFAQMVFGKKMLDIGLDVTDSRAPEARTAGIYKKVVVYDGGTIPCPDRSIGTVISNCVLEHLPDLGNSLREIHRILKPGGYFLTTVMADKWEDYMVGPRLLGNFYKQYMRRTQVHHNLLSAKAWRREFRQAGFAVRDEIGYLSPAAARRLDIAHYQSIPSLMSHKLRGTWVSHPERYTKATAERVAALTVHLVNPAASAAIFYVLKK